MQHKKTLMQNVFQEKARTIDAPQRVGAPETPFTIKVEKKPAVAVSTAKVFGVLVLVISAFLFSRMTSDLVLKESVAAFSIILMLIVLRWLGNQDQSVRPMHHHGNSN